MRTVTIITDQHSEGKNEKKSIDVRLRLSRSEHLEAIDKLLSYFHVESPLEAIRILLAKIASDTVVFIEESESARLRFLIRIEMGKRVPGHITIEGLATSIIREWINQQYQGLSLGMLDLRNALDSEERKVAECIWKAGLDDENYYQGISLNEIADRAKIPPPRIVQILEKFIQLRLVKKNVVDGVDHFLPHT